MRIANTTILTMALTATCACADNHNDQLKARVVASKFHNAKAQDIECLRPDGARTPIAPPLDIQNILSKSLLAAYLKVCATGGAWDVRFNDDAPSNSEGIEKIGHPKNNTFVTTPIDSRTMHVTANYDHVCSFKECGNYTRYTLITEGGAWKIDDIAIGLNKTHMGDSSWRENYTSLKAKLQSIASRTHSK